MNFLDKWFDIFDFADRGRPTLQVYIDPSKHKMLAFDIHGHWGKDELESGLRQFLINFTYLCRETRDRYLERAIEEAKREAGLLDKMLNRSKKWEQQAHIHVPEETFVGEAANGSVRIEIDGRLAFKDVHILDIDQEALMPLARQALKDADRKCFERWRACLLGQLDGQHLLGSGDRTEVVDVSAEEVLE